MAERPRHNEQARWVRKLSDLAARRGGALVVAQEAVAAVALGLKIHGHHIVSHAKGAAHGGLVWLTLAVCGTATGHWWCVRRARALSPTGSRYILGSRILSEYTAKTVNYKFFGASYVYYIKQIQTSRQSASFSTYSVTSLLVCLYL